MTQSWSIAQAVERLNGSILLPAIQREFVWDADQITRLFDSVMQGYPIGMFLVWHLNGEAATDEMKYRFIRHYIEDSVHPDEPKFEQMRYHNEKIQSEDELELPAEQDLVLDGQQRLTAFYIGLRGTFTEKRKYAKRMDPEAWTQKRLYVDLLSGNDDFGSDELGLQYEFSFRAPNPAQGDDSYWYRVGDVLDIDSSQDVKNEVSDLNVADPWQAYTTLSDLFDIVHDDSLIQYHEENTKQRERVLDIFIRMNDGGTPLSKSEMLLSIATARWTEGEESLDAREQITNFIDKLNSRHADKNFKFGIDFVLKALLMFGTDTIPEYRVANFSNDNLDRMKGVWLDGGFRGAIEKALDLIVEFGLDDRSLTSYNAIIPVAYYIHQHNPSLDIHSVNGLQTRKQVYYWLTSALLNGTFNSRPDEVLDDAREEIDASDGTFPLEAMHHRMRGRGKVVGFSEDVLETLLEETTYKSQKSFLLLSLLRFESTVRHGVDYHRDHIFPEDQLDAGRLVEEYDMTRSSAENIENAKNRIANLQLLTADENATKREIAFEEWIKTRTPEYCEQHRIPADEELYRVENFLDFVRAREELIRKQISELFDEFA